jgi:hypothetical protein
MPVRLNASISNFLNLLMIISITRFKGKKMPNHEEHCLHSQRRYGIRGDEIHSWMDSPAREHGVFHRRFRHDPSSVRVVGDIFGNKYGKDLAEAVAWDHIFYDREMTTLNRNQYTPQNRVPLRGNARLVLTSFKIAVSALLMVLEYQLFKAAQIAWSFVSWNLADAIVSGFTILFLEFFIIIGLFVLWRRR